MLHGLLFVAGAASILHAAPPKLTGITMFGATNFAGAWNLSYDYWDTVGGNFGFNVYLFTGFPSAPVFLNSGNTDASLNPNLVLLPGTYVIEFACDFHGWDPSTPYLGMNLYFDDESTSNRITAVVAHNGSSSFSVVSPAISTYGEGVPVPGSGSLHYTASGYTVSLMDFRVFLDTPALVSGYANTPGPESDFIGSFTLKVLPAGSPATPPTLAINPAVELRWDSATNQFYQLQWSPDPAGSNWVDLGAPIEGNGASRSVFDSASGLGRFYRVITLQ